MSLRKKSIIYGESGVLGGGGGCIMNTGGEPVPETHGGLEAGTDIDGLQPCDVLKMILYPYQYPQFTSFYIEDQPTVLEVGQVVTGGVRSFRWSTSNSQNVAANSIAISDITENTTLGSGLANDGQENLDIGSDKVGNTPNASYTWRITGQNTKGGTFSRNFTVRWRARVYWGENANSSLTENDVKNLSNNALKSGFAGTYNFTYNGTLRYYYIVYPDSWGDINSWVDTDTNFNVDYSYVGTVDITNDYGVTITYRLLRTTYQQGSDLNSQVS